MSELEDQIKEEIAAHKIVIYGKGTKEAPQCGFTVETIQFFNKYGYPFEVVNALSDPTKREALTKMTNWPTLPKVLPIFVILHISPTPATTYSHPCFLFFASTSPQDLQIRIKRRELV